nr:DUF6325 family protein [Propionicimonas sp.]
MDLGPVEIVTLTLPDAGLDTPVLGVLSSLVSGGTVRIVDAVLARRDVGGGLELAEVADVDGLDELVELVDHIEGLLADEDVAELTAGLAPGRAALVLALENTWVRPLLAAVRDSGGEVLGEVAVADVVVQEIARTVPDEEEN